MNRHFPLISRALPLAAAGLALLAPRTGRADALSNYDIQVIARVGDKVGASTSAGGLQVSGASTFTGGFGVGALNDNGQLVFGTSLDSTAVVLQYSKGSLTPIAMAGEKAPDGQTWPKDCGFFGPVGMNQAGDVALVPGVASGTPQGTYRWDQKTQSLTTVEVAGMPAVNGLVFTDDANGGGAQINNHDQILYGAAVKDVNNQGSTGLFLSGQDGTIQEVALPGDPLPGQNGKVVSASGSVSVLNDAGQVAFNATTTQDPQHLRTFLWENGVVSVIADADTSIPGFGKVFAAFSLMTNNKKSSVVLGARLVKGGPAGLFVWDSGQFTPFALPGQEMPGGGQYVGTGLQPYQWGWSSGAGEYPFVLQVNDGGVTRTAAYRVDAGGNLYFIAKSGMTTPLGTITSIGTSNSNGIALNSQGQVALTAQLDSGPDVLLLLTPKMP